MQEIGRLRELTFRTAGGGTGKAVDIDHYDTSEVAYKQLIVWDPSAKEILGGYRFHVCDETNIFLNGEIQLATAKLFNFSEKFLKDYLPHTIELGRSFVQPKYQTTNNRVKALYALDNLWDGLGALIIDNPEKQYFFGKVTMYRNYNQRARNLLLYFLEKHFPDKENLITPKIPLETFMDREEMKTTFVGGNFMDDYKILSRKVRAFGENIPPLINAYMSLSPSLKTFGTVLNPYFGDVEETAIMITINDMYKKKVERHVSSYLQRKIELGKRKTIALSDSLKRLIKKYHH
ncbi:Phospholipid/glycerol acyltransferase [sediment metagenome]|uniref:Phospholipid/glycerol acyltransferase n=1 Tax=sediment metagenome TaxID=749907 RepID=D9PG76_9ZZZZ